MIVSKKILVTVRIPIGEEKTIVISKKIPNNISLIGDQQLSISSCCSPVPVIKTYTIT